MKDFLKDQTGATTMEKIVVFSIIAGLVFALFVLRQYVLCENEKSIDRFDIAIKKEEYVGSSGKCEEEGKDNVKPIQPPPIKDEEGNSYIPISYLEEQGIELSCRNSDNYFKFDVPTNATPFSTGTQNITIKNSKGWDVWVKIMKIETENGLRITNHSEGFREVKSDGTAAFKVDWSWQTKTTDTNRGNATVLMQTVCSEPAKEEKMKFTPEPPTNFSIINRTYEDISLRWDEMDYADQYELWAEYTAFGVYSGWKLIYSGSEPSFTHANLLSGVRYNYSVYSGNTVDNLWSEDYSYASGKTKIREEVPKPPPNIHVTEQKETSVTLAWTKVENATGYIVNIEGKFIYKGPGTSYTFGNLAKGKSYQVQVASYNEYGISSFTPYIITTNGEFTIDVWVENVTKDTVTLAWNPVSGASFYTIDLGGEEIWRGKNLSKKITNLEEGATYTFKFYVAFPRDQWERVDIPVKTLGEKKIPDVPTNFRASDIKNTLIALEWDATRGATSYRLRDKSNNVLYEGPNTSFRVTNLKENTGYDFKVQAINEYGRSLDAYAYVKTRNDNFSGKSEIGNSCEVNTFEQKFQLPIGIKPGDKGQYVVEFNNNTKKNMLFEITNIETSGGLFRGETPVKLTYATAHNVVKPGTKGRIPIDWTFPANAKRGNYQDSLGTLTAIVELRCE